MSHVYYWSRDAVVPRQYVFEENLRIEAVAIGEAHCCAVSSTGLTFTWGDNRHGQLGHGDFVSRSEPHVVAGLLSKGSAKVACGGNVTAVISHNGLLQMCGEAANGALGCGETAPDRPTPQLVQALISTEVTDVALGPYVFRPSFSCCMRAFPCVRVSGWMHVCACVCVWRAIGCSRPSRISS